MGVKVRCGCIYETLFVNATFQIPYIWHSIEVSASIYKVILSQLLITVLALFSPTSVLNVDKVGSLIVQNTAILKKLITHAVSLYKIFQIVIP